MRTLLLVCAICLALLLPAATGATRPNIIIVVTDDQRFDALGVVQREQGAQARFPFFETPHLDRLAAEGARFRNAFVTHSLCSPSRATMLTGQQTYAHGVRDNKTPLRSERTWAHALRAAGYRTGYFGKFHMGDQTDRPGFTDTFTFVNQGEYSDCRFLQNGTWVETKGWVDDVTTDHAIAYIAAHKTEPFALLIGYKTPHDNRTPAPRHAHDYADISIAPPRNAAARPTFPVPAQNAWGSQAENVMNYFRCLRGVDDNVGRLLEALSANGLSEDTVVIFAGDNGYYLGEHGLRDKRTAYEESLRIPLIIRYPRAVESGTLVNAMALNVDFATTILEFAGVPLDWPQQGRSLVPLLRGQVPEDWRKDFFYENYQDPEYPAVTFDVVALRTEREKLVEYPGHPEWAQVFDLTADPGELRNLIAEPAAADLVADLRTRLEAAKRNTGKAGSPADAPAIGLNNGARIAP